MQISIKRVLTRAAVLFAVSACVIAAVTSFLFWHHLRVAQHCDIPGLSQDGQVACYYRTVFFADWPELLGLLVLYFAACLLVAWLWIWARCKMAPRAR